MTTAAIICEYNPLHKGHLYQINKIKEELSADRIICLMSGDFVERGEPALLSKEIRTRMALECGADLVLLLPVTYATAAADIFAYASVKILDMLGCVDYLCFGSECESAETLLNAADALYKEATADNPQIRALMKCGKTFAEARSGVFPEYADILKGSNNILGLEYLFALKRTDSSIKPFIIKRQGSDYNSKEVSSTSFASASGIREMISRNKLNDVLTFIPESCHSYYNDADFIYTDDFDMALLDALMRENNLSDFMDVSQHLADRIKNLLPCYKGYNDFASQLKTRNYTYSRISRALLHILLNIKEDASGLTDRVDKITHVRVLGFSKTHSDILTAVSEHGKIALITKVPDAYPSLSDLAKEELDRELYASSLYDRAISCKYGVCTTPEYSKSLVFTE